MKICPKCREMNENTQRICQKCGAILKSSTASFERYCKSCGKIYTGKVDTCPACHLPLSGRRIGKTPETHATPASKILNDRPNIAVCIFAVLIPIIGLAMSIGYLLHDETEKAKFLIKVTGIAFLINMLLIALLRFKVALY